MRLKHKGTSDGTYLVEELELRSAEQEDATQDKSFDARWMSLGVSEGERRAPASSKDLESREGSFNPIKFVVHTQSKHQCDLRFKRSASLAQQTIFALYVRPISQSKAPLSASRCQRQGTR